MWYPLKIEVLSLFLLIIIRLRDLIKSQFWLNLQNAYDLHKAYEKEKENLKAIIQCKVAA